ncbi:MAG: hypothetical protein HZY73_06715 [Micropruina sp.]|nr:MAG: hypothetical protein HZY73_06715 [Micropruina sp.]
MPFSDTLKGRLPGRSSWSKNSSMSSAASKSAKAVGLANTGEFSASAT